MSYNSPTVRFITPELVVRIMTPPSSLGDILMMEDNSGDIRLTQEIFEDEDLDSHFDFVKDGEDLLEYLHRSEEHSHPPSPDLILLNWNCISDDGEGVLTELKHNAKFEDIPVVILSGSDAELDFIKDREPRADAYISKPCRPDDLEAVSGGS